MLTITIPGEEFFNEEDQSFSTVGDVVLDLEHSLVSLSKWESKFQKPFLGGVEKTTEEVFEYIQLMILTPVFPPEVISRFTQENFSQINDYLDSKESATTFGDMPKHGGQTEIITSELIYYWMIGFNIPFECQTWHLNRLFSLIRVCNVKQSKTKKMSKAEIAQRNHRLNAERRAKLGTTG